MLMIICVDFFVHGQCLAGWMADDKTSIGVFQDAQPRPPLALG